MPRQTWLANVARQAGLTVYEAAGWRTHGSTTFNPRGVVAHHTATPPSWTSKQLTRLLRDGHGSLPGPLAHYQLDRDGDVIVIAAGRANHAGQGGWAGLTGNSSVVGIEAANQGNEEPWPVAQIRAYDRLAAAVLARLGQPAQMLCAHREWAPNRKIDPRGIAMPAMRARVARLLADGIPPPEEDDLTPEESKMLREIHRENCVARDTENVPQAPAKRTLRDRVFQSNAALGELMVAFRAGTLNSADVNAGEVAGYIVDALGPELGGAVADELHRRLAG